MSPFLPFSGRARLYVFTFLLAVISLCIFNVDSANAQSKNIQKKIDLSGRWSFQIDSLDKGVDQKWYGKKLNDSIDLPGSMTTNGKGFNITLQTPWTGSIFDSTFFQSTEYAAYRKEGSVKVPFWLQPVKYYKGPAWYQKTIYIPADWKNHGVELYIERSHWESSVWVDDDFIGMNNSLGTTQVFHISKLSPGYHRITIRIDNRVKDIDVGPNSHSISDHTQTNWNGMIGKLFLTAYNQIVIDDIQIYNDVKRKQISAQIEITSESSNVSKATLMLLASTEAIGNDLSEIKKEILLKKGKNKFTISYPMGSNPKLWDEFNPNLYTLNVTLNAMGKLHTKEVTFGMRDFEVEGSRFLVNGKPAFLRGTLECAIFPLTGYPPMDLESWMRIFKIARSYGLNHMRFHSWCPPEAAFQAADKIGFYLQIEAGSWANQGSSIGDGKPIDQYIYDESERIIKEYGNHPSFCMMAYGNEPAGKNQHKWLADYVEHFRKKDSRRLYTTGAGWPVIPESDFNSSPDPRIQAWGQELKSIINSQPPRSDYDWSSIINKWKQPTVSHEIGQWCVYPDFKEINKYTGILKAKNFEIFEDRLIKNGLENFADSFLLASGKLQSLCYKADIEAALRTKNFGGFQLLDLHDFPGQGTALVGVLNPFWEEKGYITGKEYSQFCNSVVPLARFPKMIYLNNEQLKVPIEVAQFSGAELKNIEPLWTITNNNNEIVFKGKFQHVNLPIGNGLQIGEINQSLSSIKDPGRFILNIKIDSFLNSWDFFVYPSTFPSVESKVLVTQSFDQKAIEQLENGGKVLLTLKKGSVAANKGGDIKVGFSSIFWNTAWTSGQAPHTLGVLCNPEHAAFKSFPTQYHSNWQWWDAMSHSNVILLDSVNRNIKPIVRVIDDWFSARSLGLVFECKVGKGKLIVSGIDLLSDQVNRPEARQLLYSLETYMNTESFNPQTKVDIENIKNLTKENK